MKAFACPVCRSLVFFDNDRCFTCDTELGYSRADADIVAVEKSELARCANHVLARCNWLADPERSDGLCTCCALTRTRPADGDVPALAAFARTEAAKRRLVYQLDHLNLPTTLDPADAGGPDDPPGTDDGLGGLTFDLLSSEHSPVTTGHADGLITIDMAEGNDPHREALRVKLAEPYRTLLGHLRHETGHWYWYVLIDGTPYLDRFRDLFGDEREDYAAALKTHYAGNSDDWVGTHVSNYAASHPWEDWAETFAHYLHIRDTSETAAAWGLHTDGPDLDLSLSWDAQLDVDPVEAPDSFDELARSWIALKMVLNQLNRSMGSDDLYPFTLTPAVLDKLRFAHVVISSYRSER